MDEPTDLPDGTELQLTSTDEASIDAPPPTDEPMSPEESREVQEIRARAKFVSHDELGLKLAARRGG